MFNEECDFRDPENDPSISDVESEEGSLHIEEDGVDMTFKRATIMFKDNSKLRLFCSSEICDSKLDAFCIAMNCEMCRVFDDKGNELKKFPYESKLLPQLIKRVWASKKGKERKQ